MRRLLLISAAIIYLTTTGCSQHANSGYGPIALVDLDAVAQKLGKDKEIMQMIEQRQVNLNEQVVATQNSLLQQLNQKKAELGDISDDKAKELDQLQVKANTILASTRTQAQSNLTNYQLEVINRFRDEVRPIAMEIAAKKGFHLVMSKNDSVVFAFQETIDLTDEITAAMQSKLASSHADNQLGTGASSETKASIDTKSRTDK